MTEQTKPNGLPAPARSTEIGDFDQALVRSPAMAIWFDDRLFERAKEIARHLSKAEGFVPPHILNKPEACFAVVERSLAWRLSPYAVAQATYQTPGGKVGFEGKLCQAALENSGKLEGGVKFEHFGDWSRVAGKFEIKRSEKGKDYAKLTWTRADAEGLGVIVKAKIKGEPEERTWTFDLIQAFPLNSTLWATDPKSQICYTAVRRFANLAAPGLFMGVPFDRDDYDDDDTTRAARARDITPPAPRRTDFEETPATAQAEPEPEEVKEPEFVIRSVPDDEPLWNGDDQQEFARFLLMEAERMSSDKSLLDALWESNSPQFTDLREPVAQHLRDNWPAYKPATQQA